MQVFVYGTLTDPDRVETVLGRVPGARYDLGQRAVLEGLRRVEGEYPTLVPGGRVEGRLLAVDDAGLEALDRYEGVDSGLYVRVRVPLVDPDEAGTGSNADGDPDEVWVYVGDPDRLGVDDHVTWPGDGPLIERVRTALSRRDVVIRRGE